MPVFAVAAGLEQIASYASHILMTATAVDRWITALFCAVNAAGIASFDLRGSLLAARDEQRLLCCTARGSDADSPHSSRPILPERLTEIQECFPLAVVQFPSLEVPDADLKADFCKRRKVRQG